MAAGASFVDIASFVGLIVQPMSPADATAANTYLKNDLFKASITVLSGLNGVISAVAKTSNYKT